MITLKVSQVEQLAKIVENGVAKYVVFNNNRFYGSSCSIGSEIICNVSDVDMQHVSPTIDGLQNLISKLKFKNNNTNQPIEFRIEV